MGLPVRKSVCFLHARTERKGEELTVGQRARLGRLRPLLVDALASFLFNRLQQIRDFLSFGTNELALH